MSTPIHPDDDPLAARLRDALSSEAAMVHPSDDGLQNIRAGVEHGARPWWRHPGVLAVAAAAVLGLAVGGLAVALGGDGDDSNVVAGPTTSEATGTPSPSQTTTEASDPPVAREDVYVYYTMDDGDLGPRLYREQHAAEASVEKSPVVTAVREMLAEPATDPDYSSAWPSGTELNSVEISGDTATVDVSQFTTDGSGAEGVAVQQLVYTVTANDTSVKSVRLLVDGATPTTDIDLSKPVKRAAKLDIQGLVWLLTPTQKASVGSPVEITGFGTAFEGTVSWEVREDGSDTVVQQGFTQAGANGDFADFSDTVKLPPGTYEMRAFESSAEDGRPLHVDSKTFTVE